MKRRRWNWTQVPERTGEAAGVREGGDGWREETKAEAETADVDVSVVKVHKKRVMVLIPRPPVCFYSPCRSLSSPLCIVSVQLLLSHHHFHVSGSVQLVSGGCTGCWRLPGESTRQIVAGEGVEAGGRRGEAGGDKDSSDASFTSALKQSLWRILSLSINNNSN